MEKKITPAADPSDVAAIRILLIGAKHISNEVDSYSGWLLAGFGAAFTFILSNLEHMEKFIDLAKFRCGLIVFLVGGIFAISQKLLSSYVKSAVAAAEDGMHLGKDLSDQPGELDIKKMYTRVSEVLLWPWSWIVNKSIKGIESGDYFSGIRYAVRASNLQCYCVLFQLGVSIGASIVVVTGIKV